MDKSSLGWVILIFGSQAVAGDPATGSLKVPDLLMISKPAKGFSWRHISNLEEKDVKARFFSCTSENSEARVLLIVEERFPETDKHKIAAFAAHVNSTGSKLVRDGYQLKSEIPKLDPPIPGRLSFAMTGKKKDAEAHIRNVTIFGKNIYSITVWADNAKDADRLIEVAKTFKELAK